MRKRTELIFLTKILSIKVPKTVTIIAFHVQLHSLVPISLENVKAMLRPVAKKWKEIGEALDLSDHILDEVDTNNATDECCMDNAVEFWLTYHSPSWEKLATVLRGMGEETLANKCQGKDIDMLLHVFAWVCGSQMLKFIVHLLSLCTCV